MDELIKERIEHPFRQKFVHNRALQLLEKLVTGFIDKLENNNQFIKLKDDEINRLMKVESMLIKDFSGVPPVIATLSKVAAMSPTKLKRDFKAMYGLPIYEYYQKNRMLRAKTLLMAGKYAIKEVGIMVGYTNLGHFAGSFKKSLVFSRAKSVLTIILYRTRTLSYPGAGKTKCIYCPSSERGAASVASHTCAVTILRGRGCDKH